LKHFLFSTPGRRGSSCIIIPAGRNVMLNCGVIADPGASLILVAVSKQKAKAKANPNPKTNFRISRLRSF